MNPVLALILAGMLFLGVLFSICLLVESGDWREALVGLGVALTGTAIVASVSLLISLLVNYGLAGIGV